MAGNKRTSDEAGTIASTRAMKNAKTQDSNSPNLGKKVKKAGKTKKAKKQASLTASAFTEKALPLHVHITHTPPVIDQDSDSIPMTQADPGNICTATLLPSVFSTGTYGWKGHKRVNIEVPDPNGGEPEKLQVMISINAAVLGSKHAKDSDDTEEKEPPVTEGIEEEGGREIAEEKEA